MKKIFIFIVLTIFWLILLFPKNILWNSFIQNMKHKEITITSKKTKDLRYKFIAQNVKIYYKNFEVVNISEVVAKPWLFFNEVTLKNLHPTKNIPILNNLNITNAKIIYTILTPVKINITGTSNQGNFSGIVNIFKHKGHILFKRNDKKNIFLHRYFKKTKEGMRYEFTY